MQDNTSLLSLVSLPKDTAALLQFPVDESANSGLHMMSDCSDHPSDVNSGGFSSFLLQVLTNFSTKNILNDMKAFQAKHSKIIYTLFSCIFEVWCMYLP